MSMMQSQELRKTLTEFLVENVSISREELDRAAMLQAKEKVSMVLAIQRVCSDRKDQLLEAMSEYFGFPYMQADRFVLDPLIVSHIPEDLSRRFHLIALFKLEDELTVATADPQNILALDEVRRTTGHKINIVLADEESIQRAIDKYYREVDRLERAMAEIDESLTAGEEDIREDRDDVSDLVHASQAKTVVRTVNLFLTQAIRAGASDVHVEPGSDKLRVRFRIDGVMKEIMDYPRDLQSAIISRLKIMSDMDIAEKRCPQDGRFQIASDAARIDVRVSTLPTTEGEKIVMRLLNTSDVRANIEALGMFPEEREIIEAWIRNPYGMILVTGPTGSGKTTTLYAALNRINGTDKNIVTIEDPVEYKLPIINQVNVNTKANLTFATGLRSILRQDPDVIMVGEIRDVETAEIAIKSAMTGHLVLSTLHTNDAPSAVTRLVDMGIEGFLIASGVLGVVGQRLVRKNCSKCKEADDLPLESAEDREITACLKGAELWRGKGCPECNYTGYRGRIGIYELMGVNPAIRSLIISRASSDQIKEKALQDGYRPMRSSGLQLVRQGVTTLEEVLRVTMRTD